MLQIALPLPLPLPLGAASQPGSKGSAGQRSHALEVVGLLDLGLALAAHGAAELLAGVGGRDGALRGPVLVGRQVDALPLQRDLGRQRRQVARRQQPRLQRPLPLRRELALLLGLGCGCVRAWSA